MYIIKSFSLAVMLTIANFSVASTPSASIVDRSSALQDLSPNDSPFLPVDEAFSMIVIMENNHQLRIHFDIADAYYLYRSRFEILSVAKDLVLGDAKYPDGVIHEDEFFGSQEVYYHDLDILIPYSGKGPLDISIAYQGCAEAGLCYNSQTRLISL